MPKYKELWEERASDLVSVRNDLVRDGYDPNGKAINNIEERAAFSLSKAKGSK